jgi:hypothetical protein
MVAPPVSPKLGCAGESQGRCEEEGVWRRYWMARQEREPEQGDVEIVPRRSAMIATFAIAGGVAYLWWRARERRLRLEAAGRSRSPFSSSASADAGVFTAAQLDRLSQQQFEQLVASYYARTGVVAERTPAESPGPVQIKIFWKGEPKPFAGVQCHASPPALIPAEPLERLFETLSAAGIRRGYVVTTGKFSVEAREFAAEKAFTILSGDLFLEKLNALPSAPKGRTVEGNIRRRVGRRSPRVPA